MTTLTFYGGVDEIGGNKILLEDGETRIFLDFGISFGMRNSFYDEYMRPRSGGGIKDLIALGLIPKIDGIYRKDFLELEGLVEALRGLGIHDHSIWRIDVKSYDEILERDGKPFLDAVLLSHAHLDHCQYISMLDPRIPVYCSKETKTLLECICEIGREGFEEEFIQAKIRQIGYYSRGYFPNAPKIERRPVDRTICTFDDYERITDIEGLEIKTFPVDHSVPGATAYTIQTSDGKNVVYTGDIRFHGRKRELSKRFLEELRDFEPDAMICEGTRIEKTTPDDEERVEEEICEIVSKNPNISIISFAWKDVTRFETIRDVAKDLGKTFVISPKLAYLLKKLKELYGNAFPEIEEDDFVKVYVKRADSMLYSPGDYTKSKYIAGYETDWESKGPCTKHLDNGIKVFEIKNNPSSFILHLDFFEFNELIDLGQLEDSVYIKASSEPFDEEGLITEEKLKNWLRRFGINKPKHEPIYVHASGHASGPEIMDMITKINPKVVFPVHTEHPELFNDLPMKVILAEEGKRYVLV